MEDAQPTLVKPHLRRANSVLAILIGLNLFMVIAMRIVGSQMYPFLTVFYVWIPLYILLVSVLLWKDGPARDLNSGDRSHIYLIAAFTILVRLLFIGMTQSISIDALWYLDFGRFMQMGRIPYTGFYFPYPPVFAYFIFIIANIVPSVDSFRVLAACMDAGVVLVLFRLARQLGLSSWGKTIALSYALLPISIIESGWNGHFEPIANLLMLISVSFVLQGRGRVGGLVLGLAGATKVYPLALAPILLFRFKSWRERVEYLVAIVVGAALTYLPLMILMLMNGGSSTYGPTSSSSGLLASFLGFLFSPDPTFLAVALVVVAGVLFLTLITIRQLLTNDKRSRRTAYYITVGALAVVLIAMGILSAIYPLTPASRIVYYRYPVEVGLVRGIATIGIGAAILMAEYRMWRRPEENGVSGDQLLILVSATIMLLLSRSREIFSGWYLLWSVPFVLLLKNRRLGITILLCLLFLYPSYTHENFASLGFEENRVWSDEFQSVAGWSTYVNVSDSGLSITHFDASVDSDGEFGHFRANVSSVTNVSKLDRVTICFAKSESIAFEQTTEFVARISCSWDPVFGAYAELSLSYSGIASEGIPINRTIVPETSLFTNITFIPWRYAFSAEDGDEEGGIIQNLALCIHPRVNGVCEYIVDFFYTTDAGLRSPTYLVTTSVLVACSLAACIPLTSVFKRASRRCMFEESGT